MNSPLIQSCYIYFEEDPEYAVFCIPGRYQNGQEFARAYYSHCDIRRSVFVGPTPEGLAWYPAPQSPTNQEKAVRGMARARRALEAMQKAVETRFGIGKERTILVGFSAGGVMAIDVAAHSDDPYLGVVCHHGAILDPNRLPECKHPQMPILLTHNQDDDCFKWDERYIPMKRALVRKKYRLYVKERETGGHRVSELDIQQTLHLFKQLTITKSVDKNSETPYDFVTMQK